MLLTFYIKIWYRCISLPVRRGTIKREKAKEEGGRVMSKPSLFKTTKEVER